jgi:RHS repeat-associated protein
MTAQLNRLVSLFLNKNLVAVLFLIFIGLFLAPAVARAESNTDGRTPAYLQGGAPAGSYSLSGFESVNLYNGNLSFNLPLYGLSGRGAVGHSISLPIEQKWRVLQLAVPQPGQTAIYTPAGVQSVNYSLYGAGRVVGRRTGEGEQGQEETWSRLWETFISACPQTNLLYQATLTRLTFIQQDGTEIELRDQLSGGQPAAVAQCSTTPFSRGTVFVSADSSNITFISDAVIQDSNFNPTPTADFNVSGYLMMPDGTKYRVSNGSVEWMRDRNGNTTTFSTVNENNVVINRATDSLGRTVDAKYAGPGRPYDEIAFNGVGGVARSIKIHYQSLENLLREGFVLRTPRQLFPAMGMGASDTTNFNPGKVSAVELPDNRQYQFRYNSYGELARVTLPTGGVIEYDWDFGYGHEDSRVVRRVTKRRTYETAGVLENEITYQALTQDESSGMTVAVETRSATGSLLAKTVHYFIGNPLENSGEWSSLFYTPGASGREFKTEIYDIVNGSPVLKQKIENVWEQRQPVNWYANAPNNPDQWGEPVNDPRLLETRTTLVDTNQVSKKTFAYAPSLPYNLQTDVYEYDWGTGQSGALLRRTHTDYLTDANYTSHTAAHLRGLPLATWVSSDAAGNNKVSYTEYEYDNYASDARHAPLTARSSASGHDAAFGASYTKRGNVTQITSFENAANQTGAVKVSSQYDILGNVIKTVDAKQNVSLIDYTDRFGAPDAEARSNTAPSQLNGQQTFAFPTSSTNALLWKFYAQFDYFIGLTVDAEDASGNINNTGVVNSTFYNDVLDRPTQSIVANNIPTMRQQTTIQYNDASSERKITTFSDFAAFGDNSVKSESLYDGLGRTKETRKYETGGSYIVTKTQYDSLGRAYKVTNPHRLNEVTAQNPVQWTESKIDALGRVIEVKTPDNAKAFTAYHGNRVLVIDQTGKKRISETNAIGQLKKVWEVTTQDSSTVAISFPNQPTVQHGYETTYSYDTLSNLTTVVQGGQIRSFVYDSLSRLKSATNPEFGTSPTNGTINYTYDSNGNLLTKTDPRGVTTTFTYDQLNRVLIRSYTGETNGTTPAVSYFYDGNGLTSVPAYSKSKLTKISSSVSETKYTEFDALGRVTANEQTTDGKNYPFTYKYNLSGALTEEKYPSGRVVRNNFDTDGDLAAVSSRSRAVAPMKPYANNFTYTAHGALSVMQLGNGRWESTQFNNRLQPTQLALGTSAADTSLWKLDFGYGTAANNNGNVVTQTITAPTVGAAQGFVATQNYSYDSLNRLQSAAETINSAETWKQTYTFDRFGNRKFNLSQTTAPVVGTGSEPKVINPEIDSSTNRLKEYQDADSTKDYEFDAAGNMTRDTAGRQFLYDGENKQKEVKNISSQSLAIHFYDGDGKRVKKQTQTETIIFVYSASGKLAAEYSTAAPAPPAQATTSYLTNDHLGSPRVITNHAGTVTSRRDFLPFGEEIGVNTVQTAGRNTHPQYTTDNVRQKFTGYERDIEADLDFAQARTYSFRHGRFTSPDPLTASMRLSNPQTFNRYIYCGNMPLICTDPFGLDWYRNDKLKIYQWFDGTPTGDDADDWNRVVGAANHVVYLGDGNYAALDMYSNHFTDGFSSRDAAAEMAQRFADWDLNDRAIFGQLEQRTASHDKAVAAFMAAAIIAAIRPHLLPEFLNSVLNDESSNESQSDNAPTVDTLQPGPFAGDSIPARGPERNFTPEERRQVDDIGRKTGCHTCGTTDPGTKSGHFVPDHQPPNRLNPNNNPQRLFPHCKRCSKRQGGDVRTATRRARR